MDIKPEEYKKYLNEQYLTVHEAAAILEVGEEELWELVRKHQIPTHKIAGAFLRFKKEDIDALEIKWRIQRKLFPKGEEIHAHPIAVSPVSVFDRWKDFWYYNDFYVLCSGAILLLLYLIVISQ